jgi:hypothetical protein
VRQLGRDHWELKNRGNCRSFRLPRSVGEPDLRRCKGVTGWVEHEGDVFIHTSGQPVTELCMRAARAEPALPGAEVLRLVRANALLEWASVGAGQMEFRCKGVVPVQVELGGMQAGQRCSYNVDGQGQVAMADAQGRVVLQLPTEAHVVVTIESSGYGLVR